MTPNKPTTEAGPVAITQRSTISIALVATVVAGIVANVSMMFALRNDVALVQRDVSHVVDDTKEIRTSMVKLAEEQRNDSSAIRVELSTLRTELLELRGRLREVEKIEIRKGLDK